MSLRKGASPDGAGGDKSGGGFDMDNACLSIMLPIYFFSTAFKLRELGNWCQGSDKSRDRAKLLLYALYKGQ